MISPNEGPQRLSWILAAGAAIALFFAFTFWAGVPTDSRAGVFWAQLIVLLLILCAFVLVAWHLFARPLAPKLKQPTSDPLPVKLRQRIAVVLAGGGMALFAGGIWDELWHRQFGIPFGEDFFWRPHLLMYFGFATAIVSGFWALHYLNRHLKGNFQQRFRSNVMIGLLILNAAFMLYALPADPVWHWTYGQDLSAWSVPHLILLLSFVFTLLVAILLQLSTIRMGNWRTILQLHFGDVLPLFVLAGISLVWLQLMLTEWDSTLSGVSMEWLGLYRPDWLLAANLLAGVTTMGVVATRVLRCAGAATAAGLLALVIRFGMIQILGADILHYVAWVAALLPLLAIDLWSYYSSFIRQQEPEWRGTAIAIISVMAINSIVISHLYKLETIDFVPYALATIVTGIGMSWLSHQVADWMLKGRQQSAEDEVESRVINPKLSFGVIGGFLLFIVVFMVTAAPPV